MKKETIGILAHVDSGKTTLSEAILYKTGTIRKAGRVDRGDSFMDTDKTEQRRGITIFSNSASVISGNTELIIVDTPGHADFSSETERVLSVLDYAVLVISGTDGVQTHTETLWKMLENYGIPVFVFINKMDISENSRTDIIGGLKSGLSDACIDFTEISSVYDEIALCGEELFEAFENGTLSQTIISEAISKRKIFPCCFGSALKFEGINEFLSVLDKYTVQKSYGNEFGAKVYKITHDAQGERLTHMKITGGKLTAKDVLNIRQRDGGTLEEKVNQIRIYSGAKFKSVPYAEAGDICAVCGPCTTYPGLGTGTAKNDGKPFLTPVLNYRVILPDGTDKAAALAKFRILEEEDPCLNISWNSRLSEISVAIMGEIQLEILKTVIAERFGINVEFAYTSIAYLETIRGESCGIGHYEPLKHYAEVHVRLEALPRGSGIHFESECTENELAKNWQRLIKTHIFEKQHKGVMTGSPITDIKIVLTSGRAHLKHTEGGDFRQATYRAVRNALMNADSLLLEPWYRFRLKIPENFAGRAMTDITNMGGSFSQPEINGNFAEIEGSAPVSGIRGYQTEITAYTKGTGRITLTPDGYKEAPDAEKAITEIAYNAEADTENTADSVFCSHGAGFAVKWNEVGNFCHIPPKKKAEDNTAETEYRIKSYVSRAVNDSELMKIFEMTYGPVGKPVHTALKHREKPVKPYRSQVKPKDGKEYLLIDGYNIIFAWDDLKKLSDKSLDLARTTLINRLCNFRGICENEIILVFDAYKVKHNHGEVERIHNIDVVYTKEAETADMYIEKVSHDLSRNHKVRVATSDGLEQIIIIGNGAVRVTASDFKKELETAENRIKEYIYELNNSN